MLSSESSRVSLEVRSFDNGPIVHSDTVLMTNYFQVVAGDILKFLYLNECYQQCLLHGFSVGGYIWAEAMVKMAHDLERYQPVIDRIVGHIWDSAVDITEIPVGFPRAVFPNNSVLQATVEKYIR